MLLCTTWLFAQSVKVTGVVTDKDGPITGATVKVKNTSNGVITDINGRYNIETSIGSKIVFSFIGYDTVEKEIVNNTPVNVTLTDNSQRIDEVVVTAIGIKQQKKK